MLVGYGRISTDDQELALQRDALTAAGCERIFTDTMTGSTAERPGLTEALDFCRPGDTLVVWRLDRLGRSLTNLIELLNLLAERGSASRVSPSRSIRRPVVASSSSTSSARSPSSSAS
jgi:DNA invertase Pin-like site-specific DNA recombinase